MSFFLASLRLPRVALSVVAEHYEIPMKRFYKRSRTGRPCGVRLISHARMLAIWISRSVGGAVLSYPLIGHALGLDHSSVISAYKKAEQTLAGDAALRSVTRALAERVKEQLVAKAQIEASAVKEADGLGQPREQGSRE